MSLGVREIVRRFGHSRATPATISALEENRHRAIDLALLWDESLPPSVERDHALARLQEAVMWANAAIAARAPDKDSVLPEDLPPGSVLG